MDIKIERVYWDKVSKGWRINLVSNPGSPFMAIRHDMGLPAPADFPNPHEGQSNPIIGVATSGGIKAGDFVCMTTSGLSAAPSLRVGEKPEIVKGGYNQDATRYYVDVQVGGKIHAIGLPDWMNDKLLGKHPTIACEDVYWLESTKRYYAAFVVDGERLLIALPDYLKKQGGK